MNKSPLPSSTWSSKLGFVLSAAGAAIGLGNIQRFPSVLVQEGGGAFLLIYLLCVLFLGLPLVYSELRLGQVSSSGPYGAYRYLSSRAPWSYLGIVPVLVAFFILSYYSVMTAWTVSFAWELLSVDTNTKVKTFAELSQETSRSFAFFISLLLVLALVLLRGIRVGIENLCRVLMPLLFLLLIFLVMVSLTLPSAYEGLQTLFTVDFTRLSSRSLILALGQAFFSLCIGEGVLITYGSYLDNKTPLLKTSISIIALDTLVALMAAVIIFPIIKFSKHYVEQQFHH